VVELTVAFRSFRRCWHYVYVFSADEAVAFFFFEAAEALPPHAAEARFHYADYQQIISLQPAAVISLSHFRILSRRLHYFISLPLRRAQLPFRLFTFIID